MYAKSDAMGMTQRGAPFFDWLRGETIEPLQGIATLTIIYHTDATLVQRQGFRTNLVSPLPPPQPPSQHIPLQQPFQLQALVHRKIPQGSW